MKSRFTLLAAVFALLAAISCERVENGVYIPRELRNMDLSDTASNWCWERSIRGEGTILMWEKGFGANPALAPEYKGIDMTVDIENLMAQAGRFYTFFRDSAKFILSGSYADTHPMMIMLRYDDEGTAYGGDYDSRIGALWVTPLRTRDARMNCIAHELGHSFQSQLCIDTHSGFAGGGIYEMTSQWMLWQVNPEWMTSEEYHWDAFMRQTHLALMHPENMYHSPYVLEYWSSLHGTAFIADLWRAAKGRHDVIGVYKEFTGIGQDEFNAQIYDAAARFMTYDLPRVREIAAPYANRHTSTLMEPDAEGWQTIDTLRVPQQYGYNGINIGSLAKGQSIEVAFEGLRNDEGAGWRYGLVGVDSDGRPHYSPMQTEKSGKCSIAAEDSGYDFVWLVVTAAPASHVDIDEMHADQFTGYPYKVKIVKEYTF